MKLFAIATYAAAILSLSACATPETLQATGGSRADGTVNLSYEYGMFQKPVVDMNLALVTAQARCKAWGYTDAQAFGGQINHCQQFNGYGNCLNMLVTVTYQCTGAGPH